jgi:hypothetical protein
VVLSARSRSRQQQCCQRNSGQNETVHFVLPSRGWEWKEPLEGLQPISGRNGVAP